MSRYGGYPNPDLCAKHGCFVERSKISIMSCPGCETQQQFLNAQRESALRKAIKYAQENQRTVAFYQDPATREFAFIDVEHAAGLPVLQNISPNFRLPA